MPSRPKLEPIRPVLPRSNNAEGQRKAAARTGESLAGTYPKLAAQWHPTKNAPLTPDKIAPNSYKLICWVCAKGHDFETRVNKRTLHGYGCPYCAGQRTAIEDSLAVLLPKLAAEWHPTKNDRLPVDVRPGSNRKVWWLCSKGHDWQATVGGRARGSGCPKCSGRLRSRENSFGGRYPELAAQWHPLKNGP